MLLLCKEAQAGIRYVYVIVKPQRLLVGKTPAQKAAAHFPSGTYGISEHDLVVAARSIPMTWERSYKSNTVQKTVISGQKQWTYSEPADGQMGYGWTNGWLVRIEGDSYINGNGKHIYFQKDSNGNYLTNMDEGLSLKKTASGYELTETSRYTYTFDNVGKLLSVRDKRGNSAGLQYDQQGYLSRVIDTAKRPVFTISHDSQGRITTVTDLVGNQISYGYDNFGNLSKVERNGTTISTYTYNDNHGVISKANALGETWSIDYYPKLQDKGIVKRILDPVGTERLKQGQSTAGHESSYIYDFNSKLFYTTDNNGNVLVKMVNDSGEVVQVEEIKNGKRIPVSKITYNGRSVTTTDERGNSSTIRKDEWGNIVSQTDGNGAEQKSSYTPDNKLLSVIDAQGNITRNHYDAQGNLIKTVWAEGKPEGTSTTYSYDNYGQAITETTGNAIKRATYNDQGLPVTITDGEGNTVSYTYNLTGSVTSYTDQNGNKTLYNYDSNNNLIEKTEPNGSRYIYSYDAANRLTSVTDPLGRITRYESDYKGRLIAEIDPLGNRTEQTYDGNGNKTSISRNGSTIAMTYDSQNRLSSLTDPEGNITRYDNAPTGCTSCGSSRQNIDQVTDPLGGITDYSYDKAMRLTGISDPMGNRTGIERNQLGQINKLTDAESNSTTYQNDANRRPVSRTDANGGITYYSYDKSGNLTSLTDPNGNTTTFTYDNNNRLSKDTRPMGQITSYTYHPNGLLKTVTDGNNQTTTFTYDKNSRLIETTYSDSSKNSYSYDSVGNLISYSAPNVQSSITYDQLSRKTEETVNYGKFSKTYRYSYDNQGNKQSYTSPEGITYNYSHNKNGQLTRITTPQGPITLDYQWIRNTKITYPNGITTDNSHNANHWLTRKQNAIEDINYQHDGIGNIISKTGSQTTSYGYDSTYQLINTTNSTSTETFTYDKTGNRTTSGFSHNQNNELLTTGTATYTYDNNGNIISITEAGQTTTYGYNAANRLTTVTLPNGIQINYTYDPFGRRIKKQTPTGTTYYLYSSEGLIGEYSETGATKKTYGWLPNSIWGTNPLFQVDNGNYYYYHNDHLGTPQKLTNATGIIVWQAEYTAFGKAQIAPDSTITNNLRYAGQYWDEETGLHYNWHRYYDPASGRYLSKDPIGFAGRDTNLYRYVQNNPVNRVDPSGLAGEGFVTGMVVKGTTNNAIKKCDVDPSGRRIISATIGGMAGGAVAGGVGGAAMAGVGALPGAIAGAIAGAAGGALRQTIIESAGLGQQIENGLNQFKNDLINSFQNPFGPSTGYSYYND